MNDFDSTKLNEKIPLEGHKTKSYMINIYSTHFHFEDDNDDESLELIIVSYDEFLSFMNEVDSCVFDNFEYESITITPIYENRVKQDVGGYMLFISNRTYDSTEEKEYANKLKNKIDENFDSLLKMRML